MIEYKCNRETELDLEHNIKITLKTRLASLQEIRFVSAQAVRKFQKQK